MRPKVIDAPEDIWLGYNVFDDGGHVELDQMTNEYQPRTELGRRLLNIRQKYVADGGQLINEDDLETKD